MDSRRFPDYDPMQVYRNREYACHRLSPAMFKALNESGLDPSTAHLSCIGCLDAIGSLPAGSMKGNVRDGSIQSYVQREELHWSPQQRKERDALARRIINEILKEDGHAQAHQRT